VVSQRRSLRRGRRKQLEVQVADTAENGAREESQKVGSP